MELNEVLKFIKTCNAEDLGIIHETICDRLDSIFWGQITNNTQDTICQHNNSNSYKDPNYYDDPVCYQDDKNIDDENEKYYENWIDPDWRSEDDRNDDNFLNCQVHWF